MKTTYRKWPKSSWIVQVYCNQSGGLDFVRAFHVGHEHSLDITPHATVSVRTSFPTASEDEVADLVEALGEIQKDWNKEPVAAPVLRKPSAIELPDF